jgi:hypothetical protein
MRPGDVRQDDTWGEVIVNVSRQAVKMKEFAPTPVLIA